MIRNLPSVAVWLVLAACGASQPESPWYGPRKVEELERWQITDGDDVLGFLVSLEIRDPSNPERFYRVENTSGQWVGHVTDIRRFSRRVPFQEDEEDLGVHPMAEGLALLFEVPGPLQITRPEPGEAAEASGRREDR